MRYNVIFDNEHTCDSLGEVSDLESFESIALDTYLDWMMEEAWDWEIIDGVPSPTKEQIEHWDYMISECMVCAVEWDEEAQDWDDIDYAYYLDQDKLDSIGWGYWDEVKDFYKEALGK